MVQKYNQIKMETKDYINAAEKLKMVSDIKIREQRFK